MTQIKEALKDFNPWWEGSIKLEFKEREIYKKLQKFIPLRQIIALTGLRRVGKTTLMLKIIDDSIKKDFAARNIIYFSFDEFRETEIRNVIRAYEEMMERDFKNGRYLLLLDEIQKLDSWDDQLKVIYDLFKNVKIIISGSESLFIRKKSKETLAGRIFEFKIEPLSFREFLLFKKFDFKPVGLHEQELRRLFNEFTLTMGFPELVGIKDREIIKKYLKEGIVEKIIYKDLTNLFKIKDVSVIESLLNIFMEEPGQIVELNELAAELNISRQTLSIYLSYLEESFLLRKLYNFSKSRRKVERKLKRYYPTIISAELLFKEDALSKSKVFEWLAVNQLKAEYFWRDPYKNEVDIVAAEKEIMPIEVKHRKIDTKGLISFMKKFRINTGYIISIDKEQKQTLDKKVIYIMPAFKFLLEMQQD